MSPYVHDIFFFHFTLQLLHEKLVITGTQKGQYKSSYITDLIAISHEIILIRKVLVCNIDKTIYIHIHLFEHTGSILLFDTKNVLLDAVILSYICFSFWVTTLLVK